MSVLSKLAEASARPAKGTIARGLYEIDKQGGPAGTDEQAWVRALGGLPQAISDMPGGMRLLQWSSLRPSQRVAVLFDSSHYFVKITFRYQV